MERPKCISSNAALGVSCASWNPHLLEDIEKDESVQKRATKTPKVFEKLEY